MVEPAKFLVQLLMARGVMATSLPETRHGSWQDAQDLFSVLLHTRGSVAAWGGESSFLKKLRTLALFAGIHEASLGQHFLRAGMHISGSDLGQPWRVNEEKQDSSMKEGNQPEGLSRWKVLKSLWVYVLS